MTPGELKRELAEFRLDRFHPGTLRGMTRSPEGRAVESFENEFWTSAQRSAHSLHEVSYRACFKPQLPRFFIERLTVPGDIVYDPFMGRGTTLLEAAFLRRIPCGCDINPLSTLLLRPRFSPPSLPEIRAKLESFDLNAPCGIPEELLVFYHPETLRALVNLKKSLAGCAPGDTAADWIRMVALTRLTGHSPGFFSVYTLPPNQAVSIESQKKINLKRGQTPEKRDIVPIILKKSGSLLKDLAAMPLPPLSAPPLLLAGSSVSTPEIASGSVALVVTSPPFLDVVDYALDNWLRCRFASIDPKSIRLTRTKSVDAWSEAMRATFSELARVLKKGGCAAFETGEVRCGGLRLEEYALDCGAAAGLTPVCVAVNSQSFTKTANCWGVSNNRKGTNSNRISLFVKE